MLGTHEVPTGHSSDVRHSSQTPILVSQCLRASGQSRSLAHSEHVFVRQRSESPLASAKRLQSASVSHKTQMCRVGEQTENAGDKHSSLLVHERLQSSVRASQIQPLGQSDAERQPTQRFAESHFERRCGQSSLALHSTHTLRSGSHTPPTDAQSASAAQGLGGTRSGGAGTEESSRPASGLAASARTRPASARLVSKSSDS